MTMFIKLTEMRESLYVYISGDVNPQDINELHKSFLSKVMSGIIDVDDEGPMPVFVEYLNAHGIKATIEEPELDLYF